ncbi:MAG: hypothetical protein ACRCYS_04955 [Beijerinckiaceae bacterium]
MDREALDLADEVDRIVQVTPLIEAQRDILKAAAAKLRTASSGPPDAEGG